MKHTLIAFAGAALLLATTPLFAGKPKEVVMKAVPATDSRIVYVGRTLAQDGTVSFNWSAVTARVKFTGTRLDVKITDTKADYYNVWVDKQQCAKEDFVIKVSSDTLITLAQGLKAKTEHTVILQKRTEGGQGKGTISQWITDGEFVQAEALKQRKIEFIGDSYTCGYGTEASNKERFKPETENPNLTYAAICGRLFGADIQLVSHSGLGVIRNYNDSPSPTLTDMYTWMFDSEKGTIWQPNSYKPDVVVIYLGTNDFSRGKQPHLAKWCKAYKTLLESVRAYYGAEVPIVCMASRIDSEMGNYVKEAVERSGVANVSYTVVYENAHNSVSDMGADGHPNYSGHRKIASILAPYISTVTGWELPAKPLE